MGVVGIEVKTDELKTDELEETDEMEETGKLEETDEMEEMNIYEKMQNIIHEFNSKTFKHKPNVEMNKRIYTCSDPIPIPK